MKKTLVSITAVALTLFLATTAFAATFSSPAELVSSLTGKTEADIYAERNQGKTYGQIAQENGQLEQYKDQMVEYKKAIIDERVQSGIISQENGKTLKKALEERVVACTGTPGANRQNLGKASGGGLGFGKGQNGVMGRGMGQGMGLGRTITQ